MTTYVTIEGNTYSDGTSDEGIDIKFLDNGGHWVNFLPMLSDMLTVAGDVNTVAGTVTGIASGTSVTSTLIGVASKVFSTQAGVGLFTVGNWVRLQSVANTNNYMYGEITDYTNASLTVDVQLIGGSGTFADWDIYVTGARGETGPEFLETVAITALKNTTVATNTIPYYDSASTATTTPITAFARSMLDDADASAARLTIGVGSVGELNSLATVDGESVVAGGNIVTKDLTAITGLIKGNGISQGAVVSGTDIKTIDGSSILGAGDVVTKDLTAITGLIKGNGTSQGAVVSGTDIKTVNGESILGAGNIITNSNTFTATGVIASAGLAVTLRPDGTVSTIGAFTEDAAIYNSADTTDHVAKWVNGKVIVCYATGGNLYAVAGTVAGSSISFGTALLIDTVRTNKSDYMKLAMDFDTTNFKCVVVYNDSPTTSSATAFSESGGVISKGANLTLSTIIAGMSIGIVFDPNNLTFTAFHGINSANSYILKSLSVSGLNISAGYSSAGISANDSSYNHLGLVYDTVNSHVIIQYYNGVYRTVIDNGTAYTLNAEATLYASIASDRRMLYIPSGDKTLVVIVDSTQSNYLKAYVITNTAGTLSAGSLVTLSTFSHGTYLDLAYDSSQGKAIVSFNHSDAPSAIKTAMITITGTTASMGTPVDTYTANVDTLFRPFTVFDSVSNNAIIGFKDSSNYGVAKVAAINGDTFSFIEPNFIGISEESAIDAGTVKTTINGGINTNVSGLITGTTYYVDSAGALTTVATGNDKVGKALSATSILVNGD